MSQNPDLQKTTKRRLLPTLAILLLLAGPIAAQDFDKGVEAFDRGDYATALEVFRPLAEQGDADAQNNLGIMYTNGHGVVQDDAEAAKWYRQAAEQGHAWAQFNIGNLHAHGTGVVQDHTEAAKWYRQAAEQGHATAQYYLGIVHALGQGIVQDYVRAHKWLNLAAAQDFSDSAEVLDRLAGFMTPAQIAEAQKLARERASKLQD